jgi:hypothetical protein
MSYDPEYYKGKKDELDRKFVGAKDTLIQDMFNLLNRFGETQRDLQDRLVELQGQEAESQKKTEEENKKKIEAKIK